MFELRRQALAEVDAKLETMVTDGAQIDMSIWRSFVQHPGPPGVVPEGFEFEGKLASGRGRGRRRRGRSRRRRRVRLAAEQAQKLWRS